MVNDSGNLISDSRKSLFITSLPFLQVKSGTIFDNFLIADDVEEAEKFGTETWGATKVINWVYFHSNVLNSDDVRLTGVVFLYQGPEKNMKDQQEEEERKKREDEEKSKKDDNEEDEEDENEEDEPEEEEHTEETPEEEEEGDDDVPHKDEL